MRHNSKTYLHLLSFICIFLVGYSCFKDPEPEEPFVTPTDIRIEAIVPQFLYSNKTSVLLDATRTLILNGRRTLTFKWTALEYPVNAPPVFENPVSSLTPMNNLKTGIYKIQLTVKDENGNKADSVYTLDVKNDPLTGPPTINVLKDTVVYLPKFTISGASAYSVNPPGRELKFLWSIIQQPAGSPAVKINDKTGVLTEIEGCIEGKYLLRLEVTNEIGLSAADTIELNVIKNPLGDNVKIYENLFWEYVNDFWGYSYILFIRDSRFINRNSNNMQVQVWDYTLKEWSPPDQYQWELNIDELTIYGNFIDLPDGTTAGVKVTFL